MAHQLYVTFCNASCTVAWKVMLLGVEWRWGSAKYKGMSFDESEFDEDNRDNDLSAGDIIQHVPDRKFKTDSFRVYLKFRF